METEKNNKLRHSDSKQTLKMHNTPKKPQPKAQSCPWRPHSGNSTVLTGNTCSWHCPAQFACLTFAGTLLPLGHIDPDDDDDVLANHDKHTLRVEMFYLPDCREVKSHSLPPPTPPRSLSLSCTQIESAR